MSTLDRVTGLRLSAQQLKNAQEAEQSVSRYEQLAKEFVNLLQQLRTLCRHAETLRPALQEGADSAVDWSNQGRRLELLREEMRETANVNLHEIVRPTEALMAKWEKQLETAWRSWCDEHQLAGISVPTLEKLERIFPEAVGKLRTIKRRRVELTQKDLPDTDDVAAVRALVQASNQALDEIGIADEKVRQGFQDLAAGKGVEFARLAAPDSKLRLWLDENGLLEDCRVNLA